MDPTPNIGLARHEGAETFPLPAINENFNKIDTELAKFGAHLPHDVASNTDETNWLTYNSGWKKWSEASSVIRRGMWAHLEVSLELAGSTISNGSTGDIANVAVVTVSAPWRPAEHTPLYTMGEGRMVGAYFDKNGIIYLTQITNSGDFLKGHKFNVSGWYILASAV